MVGGSLHGRDNMGYLETAFQEGPLKAALLLLAEPGPEAGGQLGQGAAQAVGAVGNAEDGKGQDEDEKGGHSSSSSSQFSSKNLKRQ